MKILTHLNKTTFNAKPVYPIKLKTIDENGNSKYVNGNFSELSIKNFNDTKLVTQIKERWAPPDRYILSSQIADNFFDACIEKNQNKFYITETTDSNDNYARTKSIMEITNPKAEDKTLFIIEFLQSKASLKKEIPQIKGAGELSVYGAIRLAKENAFERVYIYSKANEFYKKIGLPPLIEMEANDGFFVIEKENYDAFIKKVEDKYEIKTN